MQLVHTGRCFQRCALFAPVWLFLSHWPLRWVAGLSFSQVCVIIILIGNVDVPFVLVWCGVGRSCFILELAGSLCEDVYFLVMTLHLFDVLVQIVDSHFLWWIWELHAFVIGLKSDEIDKVAELLFETIWGNLALLDLQYFNQLPL